MRTLDPALDEDGRVARLVADLANVRRHRDEAIERARREEKVAGLLALAEVQDDLERSLAAMPERRGPWFDGHEAIRSKVRSMIHRAGARPVGVAGELFDPRIHEAVGVVPGEDGRVAEVEQVGFQLDDGTLVRPARVRVGAAGGER